MSIRLGGIKIQTTSFTTEGGLSPTPTGQYPETGFSSAIVLNHDQTSKWVTAHVNTGSNVNVSIQGSLNGTQWASIYNPDIAPSGSYITLLPLCTHYRIFVDAQDDNAIRTTTLRIGN